MSLQVMGAHNIVSKANALVHWEIRSYEVSVPNSTFTAEQIVNILRKLT